MERKAIIIGAGPAGLTAAYELLTRTDIIPIILEKSGEIGHTSQTTNYKGNRMDMGPHRFFSKSDRLMNWWLKMMPLEPGTPDDVTVSYQSRSRSVRANETRDEDKTMLVIRRLTRIYFLRKFFAYPIQLSLDTLKTLGLVRTVRILVSFLWIRLFPRTPEASLENFIINKFGKQLYLLFFKDYTEKVWGITPDKIPAEWGAQRIKGVSLGKAIAGAVKSLRKKLSGDIAQKGTETSLIEQFLYPKYGPGSLWEEVARQVQDMGGHIHLHQDVQFIHSRAGKIHSVNIVNSQTGQSGVWEGDFFFSTMPVQELTAAMGHSVPGTYDEIEKIRAYTDTFENLFLVGRNGMHKYNNADHFMLTAMVAVDNIAAGSTSKANIWAINTEQEYHEEKTAAETTKPAPTRSQVKSPFLVDYLWNNKPNRAWWLLGLAAFLIKFVIFKFRYPFANYMPDSYSYLEAASNNADVNMWPVAYSKFLRLISVFTHQDKVVVGSQYLFLQCSSLIFLFTLLYWLKPGRGIKSILLLFLLLNPLPLYVANYISADALFIGLSLLWLTTLVWTIFQPKSWLIVLHGLLLLTCFTVRYNAIYYPCISILAYLLSRQSWPRRLAGIGLGVALVAVSYFWTSQKMKDTTGKWEFSAFGGWQMANNALYMYQHIPAGRRGPVPVRYAGLEAMVRQHMDTLRKVKFSHEDSANSYFYLWSGRGPLIQYLDRQYLKDSTTAYFRKWASEGPLYAGYAFYLIRKFPLEFAENWLGPNAVKFAAPPTEFLGTYNMGEDSVGKLAKDWFNYKSRKVQHHDKKKKKADIIAATEWFPIFGAMANILLVMGLIGVAYVGAIKWKEYGIPQLLAIVAALWLINGAFSIFASPVVLRYQVFPLFIAFCVGAILIERIYKLAK